MFRREQEPILARQDMDGIIKLLMRIDENVKAIREQVVEEDDGEAEEDQ